MWPFKKKVKQRRLEVRKKAQAARPFFWKRFREAGGVASVLLAALCYVGAGAMDVWPTNPLPYRIGQYLPNDIYARVGFEIPSPERREEMIKNARRETPATFRLDEARLKGIVGELNALPDTLQAATQPDDLDEKLRLRFGLTEAKDLKTWSGLAQPAKREKYAEQLRRLDMRLRQTFVVPDQELADQKARGATAFTAESGAGAKERSIYSLIGLDETERIEAEATRLVRNMGKPVPPGIETYLRVVLSEAPLYAFDATASQEALNEALRAIDADPPTHDYAAGERLVRRSRRDGEVGSLGLSEEKYHVLRKEHETACCVEGLDRFPGLLAALGGRAGLLLLVIVPLCIYIARYQPRIVSNHWRGLAMASVVLLLLALNRTMVTVLQLNPHVAVLPVITGAIVLTIAYDQRFALAVSAAMAILVVLQLRAGMDIFVVLLVATAATIFQLREIRTRSKLIEVAGITAALVAVTVGLLGLAHAVPWRFVALDMLWAGITSVLVGFLVLGILPGIERMFGVATSMTMLEWCDASKPLLKRLAMEVPGTYNHSLQLGTMCEAAAETVAARGLQARVGAYYHDIGKILKPDYFVENQGSATSKHEKLSPAMSLLIIIGHVKDGLEMAREYGLPKVLFEFIATHHGTTLVQYFYQVATEQRKDDKDRAPDEVEFRYPGPKPQSKEAAILMLADASESSVRAMGEPTPGRIENQVHAMVSRRLMDGQLDECELTLKEVHQIEASLVKSLRGVYHGRITYPTPAGEKPSAAERRAEKETPPAAEAEEPNEQDADENGRGEGRG